MNGNHKSLNTSLVATAATSAAPRPDPSSDNTNRN